MNLDEITDDEIAAAMDSEYSDCRGVAWFDSHGLSKQHELLLFRALDACLGALHHICCDDVACELCDERMTSSPPALIK